VVFASCLLPPFAYKQPGAGRRQLYKVFRCGFSTILRVDCGPGSSAGIATYYGLDGPGSNPGGDEIFRACRPALGPIQPSVRWVPGLSRG